MQLSPRDLCKEAQLPTSMCVFFSNSLTYPLVSAVTKPLETPDVGNFLKPTNLIFRKTEDLTDMNDEAFLLRH